LFEVDVAAELEPAISNCEASFPDEEA